MRFHLRSVQVSLAASTTIDREECDEWGLIHLNSLVELRSLDMDEEYKGNVEAYAEDYSIEPADTRIPFCALLDVGLIRTTTENRFFLLLSRVHLMVCLIPHVAQYFADFEKEEKQLNAEARRKYVYVGHIAQYMKLCI